MPTITIDGKVYIITESKKPTGLNITRNGNEFKFSWKCGDKNYGTGQQLYYKTNQMKSWTRLACGSSARNKKHSVNFSNFIPSTEKAFKNIKFKVRGNRTNWYDKKGYHAPEWSDYSTKEFTIKKPKAPSLSVSLDEELTNKSTFSWSAGNPSSGHRIFSAVQWQSVLLKNSNITDGKKAFSEKQKSARVSGTYISGTGGASGSRAIPEDNTYINGANSYTRWFRVRSRGPAGSSKWVYKRHVYARPNKTTDVTAVAVKQTNGYKVTVKWSSSRSAARPINSMLIQYWITAPAEGMTAPSGEGWTDVMSVAYKDGSDKAVFVIGDTLDDDQCIFVRVNTVHDPNVTPSYGTPVIALAGKLATPELTSVVTVDSTFSATVTATNKSEVEDSFMVVTYERDNDPSNILYLGIIPNGQTSVVVRAPDWTGVSAKAFGVFAAVGNYTTQETAEGVTVYALNPYSGKPLMISDTTWNNGTVPAAPDNVSVNPSDVAGTIRVNWDWSWESANGAELSWSQNPNAWESTDQPSTYEVTNMHAAQWYISNLEVGVDWYIRVRLYTSIGEDKTFGPYSETMRISLASAPSIPTLELSEPVIAQDGTVTASWGYVSTDGTPQAYAELAEVTIGQSGYEYSEPIATVETAQHIDLNAADLGWQTGETYLLAVRVVSASGQASDGWSDPVPLIIAEPLTAEITQISLVQKQVPADDDQGTTETVTALADMPLTITVTGAGETGTTTVAIERAESYYLDRPDERDFTGHEGETVLLMTQLGEAQMTISNTDLIGTLDDGALYRIVATVSDEIGQSAEVSQEFVVAWAHQALIPTATIQADNNYKIMKITPVAPEGAEAGDTCDIYRLSVDRPELIYPNAQFGTTYVDPFPALGEMGGHRIVFRTANGDYITEDNELAWTDYQEEAGDNISTMFNLIDFGGDQVAVMYDIELSSGWEKDFQQTKYLGGHIQGDWNAAVSRSGSVSGSLVTTQDQETIQALRRLADYPGICHVRTRDGSSYAADVQVNETRDMGRDVIRSEFSLSITRVDPEGYDGMTLADWERQSGGDEEETATVGTAEVGTATAG